MTMCSKPSVPKAKPAPPIQPPAIQEKAPEVRIGAETEGGTKRKKIGREQLRQPIGTGSSPKSGVGV